MKKLSNLVLKNLLIKFLNKNNIKYKIFYNKELKLYIINIIDENNKYIQEIPVINIINENFYIYDNINYNKINLLNLKNILKK